MHTPLTPVLVAGVLAMLARGGTRPGTLGGVFTVIGVAGVLVGLVAVGTRALLVLVTKVPT